MKNIVKSGIWTAAIAACLFANQGYAQTTAPKSETMTADQRAKSDIDQQKKSAEWVAGLKVNDAAKEKRVQEVIAAHLKAVRDWHNDHHFSTVPAGINPVTGTKLSDLDRQIIANSAMPKSVHENLMAGLRKDLTEEQVEAVLDQYTIGKVAFTMKAYKEIVPNMTAEEEATLVKNLKQAREQAIDYKNMNQISAIFEIYKTKNEQFLSTNGRSWKQMYKEYTNMLKAKKAAAAEAEKAKANK
jgi:hypothetical protein